MPIEFDFVVREREIEEISRSNYLEARRIVTLYDDGTLTGRFLRKPPEESGYEHLPERGTPDEISRMSETGARLPRWTLIAAGIFLGLLALGLLYDDGTLTGRFLRKPPEESGYEHLPERGTPDEISRMSETGARLPRWTLIAAGIFLGLLALGLWAWLSKL